VVVVTEGYPNRGLRVLAQITRPLHGPMSVPNDRTARNTGLLLDTNRLFSLGSPFLSISDCSNNKPRHQVRRRKHVLPSKASRWLQGFLTMSPCSPRTNVWRNSSSTFPLWNTPKGRWSNGVVSLIRRLKTGQKSRRQRKSHPTSSNPSRRGIATRRRM